MRFILDLQPKGLMKVAGPLITNTMQKEVAHLQKLKTVLEAVG
ncbi:MAG: hypothetical protein ABIX44_08845 [Cryobacterium sp.]